MPEFSRALSIYQGFNFKKDKQDRVGLVTSLTIGGEALAVDLTTAKDPTNPTAALASVVILDSFQWGTGVTDSLYFSGRVSRANKVKLSAMLLGSFTNTEAKVNFSIFEYDPLAKKYFKSCYPNAECEGLLEKSGDELNLHVDEDPASEVQSPINFGFTIGIKPQEKEQSINIAVKDQAPVTKSWGLTVTV